MIAHEQLINRRKWFKDNSRKLRNEINGILKRDHTINADSYMRNKEVATELEIFFSNRETFIKPDSGVKSIVSSLAAIGLLVSVLTPNTLKGVYSVDALLAKLESMQRVINSGIEECEVKYPELKSLYKSYCENKINSDFIKLKMNSTYGLNHHE